jgi:chaperone LolA
LREDQGVRSFLASLFLLPIGAAFAQQLSDRDAESYLKQLAASRSGSVVTEVDFAETRTSPLLKEPITTQGTLQFAPPDHFRREISGANGSVMISDGTTFWIYYPALKEAERYSIKSAGGAAAAAMQALVAAFQAQDLNHLFQVTVTREDDSYRIVLIPRQHAQRKFVTTIILLIGPNREMSKAAWKSPDGEITEINFANERSIKAGDFTFHPPDGTEITTPLGR